MGNCLLSLGGPGDGAIAAEIPILLAQRCLRYRPGDPPLTFGGECAKIWILGLIGEGPLSPVVRFTCAYLSSYPFVPRSRLTQRRGPHPGAPVPGRVRCLMAGEGPVGAHLFSCRLRGPGLIAVGGYL